MSETCYVCLDSMDLEKVSPYYCHRTIGNGVEYRHLWHGVPGITKAVGGGGGFNGYAKTLKLARQRAEYYLNENPWAAPEVLQGELEVLKAVEHEEMNNA